MVFLSSDLPVIGQFPQMERSRRRIDASVRASEEREHDQRLEEANKLPEPKPAVMNVDVQMVLSKAEYKTFAEAKAREAKRIVDGEPLWLYVKFKGKLGDYVLTTRDAVDREKLRYTLWLETAPKGDAATLHQYTIQFAKEDLAANELRINLAPGLFGRNRSLPVFLMTSAGTKSGVWINELRLTNRTFIPRSLSDNLSATAFTLDLSAGSGKYRKMESEYDSIILRGTTDLSKLPLPGMFNSEELRSRVSAKLQAEGIRPERIYFSGDDWHEFAAFLPTSKRVRKVFASFVYRREASCFYGVAEISETFDMLNAKYGEAEISFQKDISVPCAEIN